MKKVPSVAEAIDAVKGAVGLAPSSEGGSADNLSSANPDRLNKQRKVSRLADKMPVPTGGKGSGRLDMDYQKMVDSENESAGIGKKAWKIFAAHVPVVRWLPTYDWKNNIFYDFSGGTTIALVCLVQTLAHAAIATTSVIQGPYCAFVPPFVYAVLGTSPHASISSGAIAAILIADQLSPWPEIQDRTELACLLALTSGIILVFLGLFKFAFLVRFLSQSLLSGFISGGSILIVIGQLANWLGIEVMPHGVPPMVTLQNLVAKAPTESNTVSICLGLTMLTVLELSMRLKKDVSKRISAKVDPAAPKPMWLKPVKVAVEMKELILVFLSILFAWSTCTYGPDGEIHTILPTIGQIPPGLPPFKPSWTFPACQRLLDEGGDRHLLHRFLGGSFLVSMTTFLTTYSTCKKQALIHNYELDASQEMFALGSASVSGSFFGTFPPSGSLSRTSLASEVGVKSQMSGLMQIVVVGSSLTFFTPTLYFLPKTALASIILRATMNLIDLDTPKRLYANWKPRREGGHKRDLGVWCIAFGLTIYMGVIYGVGAAVVLSLAMIVKDSSRPRMVVLGKLPGNVWRDLEVWPEGLTEPGVLVLEFRGPLNFASADFFQEEIQRLRTQYDAMEKMSSGGSVMVIVLNFASCHDIDPTAMTMLKDLLSVWSGQVEVVVADAKSRVRLLLEETLAVSAGGKKALLDQPAFMIGLDKAVEIATDRARLRMPVKSAA